MGNAMSHGRITSDLETRRPRSQSLLQLSILASEQNQSEKPEDGSGYRNRIKKKILFSTSQHDQAYFYLGKPLTE